MIKNLVEWTFKLLLITLGIYLVMYVALTIFVMYANLATYH